MSEFKHYTDEDFQKYLEQDFEGDTLHFENHLQVCNKCNEHFETYKQLWSYIGKEIKTETFDHKFVESILTKALPLKQKAVTTEKLVYALFITLIILCLAYCLNYLFTNSSPEAIFLLILPLGLYMLLGLKEIRLLNQKFA